MILRYFKTNSGQNLLRVFVLEQTESQLNGSVLRGRSLKGGLEMICFAR